VLSMVLKECPCSRRCWANFEVWLLFLKASCHTLKLYSFYVLERTRSVSVKKTKVLMFLVPCNACVM
jgi:hypothetical protein